MLLLFMGLIIHSDNQNVSSDFKGILFAVAIEGHDTHTRTGFIDFKPEILRKMGLNTDNKLSIPVTHSTLFGWYDNEYGS